MTADASDTGVTSPDSIATVEELSEVQSGTQHWVRRWVATTEPSEGPGPADYFTVLYTRGSEPRWSRLPVPELNEPRADSFCESLATSDSTALAVYTTVRNLS